MIETYTTYVEDLSVPHLTGSKVVIDQLGTPTVEQIVWEYLGDGAYCEREAYYSLLDEDSEK